MSQLKKQFQFTLYEKEILITTPANNNDAYEARINYQQGKRMLILDRNGMQHDWIETEVSALNYHECCGMCG